MSRRYAVMTLDREIRGAWDHMLEAWDACTDAFARGEPRVAIIDALTREILMVLVSPKHLEQSTRGRPA